MSNKLHFKKHLMTLVCLLLITAVACAVVGCQKTDSETPQASSSVQSTEESVSQVASDPSEESTSQVASDPSEEQIHFTFKVIDGEGKETTLDIATTEKTVGAALLAKGLIEGEDGQFGLYVKKVNGIEADYDKDGTYWAFYIDGEYAMTGVDTTDIVPGTTYTLKVEKG